MLTLIASLMLSFVILHVDLCVGVVLDVMYYVVLNVTFVALWLIISYHGVVNDVVADAFNDI